MHANTSSSNETIMTNVEVSCENWFGDRSWPTSQQLALPQYQHQKVAWVFQGFGS